MPRALGHANAKKSKIRARVEHVFAEQKDRMGLFIRTIGIARAEATILLANMAYNMKRWCWLDGRPAPAGDGTASKTHTATTTREHKQGQAQPETTNLTASYPQ
jgi:hypothetical protein